MAYNDFHPELRPFITDFGNLEVGQFLTSSFYERRLVKWGFSGMWQRALENVQKNSKIIFLGHDMSSYDAREAFIYLANSLYKKQGISSEVFYNFIYYTLESFIAWNRNPVDLADVFEDLELLDFPANLLINLKKAFQKKVAENLPEETNNLVTNQDFKVQEDDLLKIKKSEWLSLIAKAKIDFVITELLDFLENSRQGYFTECVNISSRYYRLQDKLQKDVIDADVESKEINKINESLIWLIGKID